jgi:ATPase subunit of ABC transporter with duplicated ATPase domains
MLTLTDLAKTFGPQVLFEQASLQLNAGGRYGIVGANGSGKSTLLRILSEEESPSEGEVNRVKKARMGVLEQDHFAFESTPVLDVVMMGNDILWQAMKDKDALLERAHEEFDDEKYTRLEDIVLRYDGYSLEARAAEILAGLNIPTEQHKQPLSVLSGGYKLRALLGKTLASEPDILLLDEPTNHLDILSIQWLESFLLGFRGCAVVVSHDHRFLNRVCTHIIDVDYERVTLYRGNYEAFCHQKLAARARMESEIAKREKEIAVHKAFITRFKAKATKARQANSRAKRVEKIVIESLPQSSRRHPLFKLKARRPSGRDVLAVNGIWKAFGDNSVLEDVSFTVERGDRLAIIGPNGIGKSTLLKIILEELEADAGTFDWGFEADPGYFPQDHKAALGKPGQTVLGFLWDAKGDAPIGTIHGKLAEVLFTRDDVEKKIQNLSGGEAARLLMSRLAIREHTVLVLDEPTNHLDMEGIEALAEGLKAYDGTILFVSHDRWFVDKVATRVLEITTEGINDFPGTYAEYVARDQEDHLSLEAVAEKARLEKKAAKAERKRQKKKERAEAEKSVPAKSAAEKAAAEGETAERRGGGRKSGKKGKKRNRGR